MPIYLKGLAVSHRLPPQDGPSSFPVTGDVARYVASTASRDPVQFGQVFVLDLGGRIRRVLGPGSSHRRFQQVEAAFGDRGRDLCTKPREGRGLVHDYGGAGLSALCAGLVVRDTFGTQARRHPAVRSDPPSRALIRRLAVAAVPGRAAGYPGLRPGGMPGAPAPWLPARPGPGERSGPGRPCRR